MKSVLDERPVSSSAADLGRIEQLLRWILLIQVVVLAEETVEFTIKLLRIAVR
jgi:hypothetical protein